MEFGLFFNGYLPGPAAHDTEAEHLMLMREAEYAIHADKYNWKYAWCGEHHCLTEYSHMSAPYPFMGYVAAKTDRIHLGSAITSFPTTKEHPARFAERAAMMDHLTEGRFEFGTGRGAGSHEVATFNGTVLSETKAMWDEVAHEIPRMWEQKDYSHDGEHFSVPTPHNILPKPYGKGHPPIWVACGNPATFAKAGGHGIGAIAFNFEPIHNLKGRVEAYKEASENVTDQIGQFQNNNVMMTNAVICLEDREEARTLAKRNVRGYRVTMVNMYHDSMPKSPDAVVWPNAPVRYPMDDEMLDMAIKGGFMLCGNPEEVCEQVVAYQDVGCDQVCFGTPDEGYTHDQTLEMIEVFGKHVIPEFDKDPVHSTTRYRETAQPQFPVFNGDVDPIVNNATPPPFTVSV
ncbi:MAG: LLM class flavin-dependent oxidoreductase [Acidimicrobiaceae bacterium]|nr:LLM class flavin-dependent oxidoreductase [Acidimicrobiaceae bacterium]MXW60751.1 LLM class flavin-dependent oxidoreductase [Acidimicrobiaceae bacterium]MXW75210.1 LLM class flavin-dependent oxidoreductase [Acidimicrobiaceae bacterium]MYA74076.1 LLM class flavin-dependent oxidoreductase [Acidimicrobiaceae bacterium]MYC42371.1 LLM class flavin-dependent oxidoreductase [Acidimicrobiaceae bacterium]